MKEEMSYRFMDEDEAEKVCAFVIRIFHATIAPLYLQEGIDEFLSYVRPEAMLKRIREDAFTLLAEFNDEVAGIIHVHSCNHISLLFVHESYQRKGIARDLLKRTVKICKDKSPGLTKITVNSSPNSIQAYHRLGFQDTGLEDVKNGIRFTPMSIDLPEE